MGNRCLKNNSEIISEIISEKNVFLTNRYFWWFLMGFGPRECEHRISREKIPPGKVSNLNFDEIMTPPGANENRI